MTTHENQIPLFIRRVMPNATAAELREATDTFTRFLRTIIGIHERIEHDKLEAIRTNTDREVESYTTV
ncbi:hypothetical protein [Bradyrhizobium japonicum]|uniref:hypothetical protein n=1 Tax=Bradyrhizobium japonicum TaxID=375 RepID=UPI0027154697|nr:hypothetical protein [Bradyrhizobium japonicum]WLB21915.1 hypothetical protein QIH95_14080 [Bradyrhizobium japonicum]